MPNCLKRPSQVKSWSLLPIWFAATIYAQSTEADFRVELGKAGDGVVLYPYPKAYEISITSQSGIGDAKLIRSGDRWPPHITIRLRLGGLESFWMRNGEIHFETFLRGPQKVPFSKIDKSGNPNQTHAGSLDIVMVQRGRTIEITVPKELLVGNPSQISFGWIDFYRR